MSCGTSFIRFFYPGFDKAKRKEFEDTLSEFHRLSDDALKLDTQCEYSQAVQSYGRARDVLGTILENYQQKFNRQKRLVYERQGLQMSSRQTYLDQLVANGQADSAIVIPTRFSLTKVLQDPTSLSRAQKASGATVLSLTLDVDFCQTKPPASPLSSLTSSGLAPVEYLISQERHMIAGAAIEDLIISDAETKQMLWILHATVAHNQKLGLEDTVLQRASESMPGDQAIKVRIYKTPKTFNLRMQSQATGYALEQSDRGKSLKHWAPRRLRYGGRQFVWKPHENWEVLFETAQVSNVEGSQNGEKLDETVGDPLCWGSLTGSEDRATVAKVCFRRGLDQGLVEHCLASTLSRWQRQRHPATDDTVSGKALLVGGIVVGAVAAGTGVGLGS